MRSQSWLAFVSAAGGKCGSVEFIDCCAIVRSKRDMQSAGNWTITANKKLRQPTATKARPLPSIFAIDVYQSLDTKRCQSSHVERPT